MLLEEREIAEVRGAAAQVQIAFVRDEAHRGCLGVRAGASP
jgi:hypothetical protein